jgi:hypothetical protein
MLATQQASELVTDDFQELLLGSQALENLLAERFRLDGIEKGFDDFHMDVGFQESQADIPESVVDIFLADFSLAAQPFKRQL